MHFITPHSPRWERSVNVLLGVGPIVVAINTESSLSVEENFARRSFFRAPRK
jgi:hypothetical protein